MVSTVISSARNLACLMVNFSYGFDSQGSRSSSSSSAPGGASTVYSTGGGGGGGSGTCPGGGGHIRPGGRVSSGARPVAVKSGRSHSPNSASRSSPPSPTAISSHDHLSRLPPTLAQELRSPRSWL